MPCPMSTLPKAPRGHLAEGVSGKAWPSLRCALQAAPGPHPDPWVASDSPTWPARQGSVFSRTQPSPWGVPFPISPGGKPRPVEPTAPVRTGPSPLRVHPEGSLPPKASPGASAARIQGSLPRGTQGPSPGDGPVENRLPAPRPGGEGQRWRWRGTCYAAAAPPSPAGAKALRPQRGIWEARVGPACRGAAVQRGVGTGPGRSQAASARPPSSPWAAASRGH